MSNSRHGGKSVRFNEGSQQSGSSRYHRREDERDSGLGSSSSEQTSHRRGRPDWGFTAADRQYQINNLEALQEAYASLMAENQNLKAVISKRDESLSISHRTIKQLESHASALATARDELQTKNSECMDDIARLRSENEDLQRRHVDCQAEITALREQLFMASAVSDKMSGASGPSGASGTSGSSSNKITRRPSKHENQEKERLKGRFNRSNQNDGPVASTSAMQPMAQRQRRPSIAAAGRPYIEEPESRHYNIVSRPALGHEQARVPRSSHPASSGDYQFHPLPKDPSRR